MANAAVERRPEAVGVRSQGGSARFGAGLWTLADLTANVGVLGPGETVWALSKGAISMTDAIGAALETTGPAALTLTTWTVAANEIGALARLLEDRRITALRLLTDDSLRRRHPAYVASWRAVFGAGSIRLAKCHMKAAVVVGAERAVTVLSSANMNAARRLESFVWHEGRELADLITGALAYWFEGPENVAADTGTITRAFEAWGERPQDGASAGPRRDRSRERARDRATTSAAPGALQAAVPEDAAFFSSDPFGVDLRRKGASYL